MLKKWIIIIPLLFVSSCIDKKKVENQPHPQTTCVKHVKNSIREINSIDQVKEIAEHYIQLGFCPRDILTIFDVDETLLSSYAEKNSIKKIIRSRELFPYIAQKILLHNLSEDDIKQIGKDNININNKKLKQLLNKPFLDAVSRKTYTMLATLYKSKRLKTQPVQNNTVHILDSLEKCGIKTMGLTARGFDLAQTTLQQLRDVGIDFSKHTIYNCQHMLNQVHGFVQGFIFCTPGAPHFDKGKLLTKFFTEICYCPRVIIFTDDYLHFVKSV